MADLSTIRVVLRDLRAGLIQEVIEVERALHRLELHELGDHARRPDKQCKACK